MMTESLICARANLVANVIQGYRHVQCVKFRARQIVALSVEDANAVLIATRA